MVGDFTAPLIPGYTWLEHRRSQGKRGGIALLIRQGISILSHHSNEVAQVVTILGPHGARGALCNVYIPPVGTLSRRRLSEEVAL